MPPRPGLNRVRALNKIDLSLLLSLKQVEAPKPLQSHRVISFLLGQQETLSRQANCASRGTVNDAHGSRRSFADAQEDAPFLSVASSHIQSGPPGLCVYTSFRMSLATCGAKRLPLAWPCCLFPRDCLRATAGRAGWRMTDLCKSSITHMLPRVSISCRPHGR